MQSILSPNTVTPKKREFFKAARDRGCEFVSTGKPHISQQIQQKSQI